MTRYVKMRYILNAKICFLLLMLRCDGTIDINLPEYQYIADHLTEDECHKLVAALHFHEFHLPQGLNSAERRLPQDVPCIDLLLHWNSTPREGRGQTHVEVCHRLNQIGRKDLAEWLSKTVFHQLSNDLKFSLNSSFTERTSQSSNSSEIYLDEFLDEAAWWKLDTFLSILIVIGSVTILIGSFYLCCLCLTRTSGTSSGGYKPLETTYD